MTTATLTVSSLSVDFRVITSAGPAFTTLPQVMGTYQTGSNLGLRSDGLVFEWGYSPLSATPVQRTDISGVRRLVLGRKTYWIHTLALRADGTLWAWGANDKGQLGTGTTISASTAVPVVGISGVSAIAAGGARLKS